jgi:uncharacterized protein (DUF1330 family)
LDRTDQRIHEVLNRETREYGSIRLTTVEMPRISSEAGPGPEPQGRPCVGLMERDGTGCVLPAVRSLRQRTASMTSQGIDQGSDRRDNRRRANNTQGVAMQCYAVAILREVQMGPPIVEYLERIDESLAPFDGHFIVHGGKTDVLEGGSPGVLVVIEFPDHEHAQRWYASHAYQQILPLRTGSSESTVFLIEGVDRAHKATDVLGAGSERQ